MNNGGQRVANAWRHEASGGRDRSMYLACQYELNADEELKLLEKLHFRLAHATACRMFLISPCARRDGRSFQSEDVPRS